MKKVILCTLFLLTGYATLFAHNGKSASAATSFASLPVKETYIPNDVLDKLRKECGPELYDITRIKGKDGQVEYCVRIKDNGTMKVDYKKVTSLESV